MSNVKDIRDGVTPVPDSVTNDLYLKGYDKGYYTGYNQALKDIAKNMKFLESSNTSRYELAKKEQVKPTRTKNLI